MFIERENGKIIGVYANRQDYATEELPEDNAEVILFRNRMSAIDEISDRQFFHALALSGMITQDEALTAVKIGTLPAAFEVFVGGLPTDDQFNARMLLEGATTFKRSHPLTAAFGAMSGMTPTQIDALWQLAAGL